MSEPLPGTTPPDEPPFGAPTPPPMPQPPQGAYGPATLMSDADQRTWAMLAQLGGIIFYFVPALVVYLVTKGRGAFVETESKEALNFQITIAIAWAVGFVTLFVYIGALILLAVAICDIVFCILAAVANYAGKPYRYPLSIRFLK